MDEKKGTTRGPDDLLHWQDIRDQFYIKEEQRLNDLLAELIGAMVSRRRQPGLTQEQLAEKPGSSNRRSPGWRPGTQCRA